MTGQAFFPWGVLFFGRGLTVQRVGWKSSGHVVAEGTFCLLPGGLEMVRPLGGGRRLGTVPEQRLDLYLPTPSSPPSGQCQADTAGQLAGSDFMTQLPGGMKRERKLTSSPASLSNIELIVILFFIYKNTNFPLQKENEYNMGHILLYKIYLVAEVINSYICQQT